KRRTQLSDSSAAKRLDEALADVQAKVYTRDLYGKALYPDAQPNVLLRSWHPATASVATRAVTRRSGWPDIRQCATVQWLAAGVAVPPDGAAGMVKSAIDTPVLVPAAQAEQPCRNHVCREYIKGRTALKNLYGCS